MHIGGILCCRGFSNPRRIKSGFVIRTKRNQKVKIKGITNPQLNSCGFGDPQEHKHYLFFGIGQANSLQRMKYEETYVGVTREAGGRTQAGGEGEARNP